MITPAPCRRRWCGRRAAAPTRKALLYIHGYLDYFYQTHLADECNARGFNFYALDLRKYGRSLREGQRLAFCKDVREYFAEISTSLLIVSEDEGNDWIALSGHSTGGLTSALYADAGEQRARINALVFEQPLFLISTSAPESAFSFGSPRGWLHSSPSFQAAKRGTSPYMESIHADHRGEWSFDTDYRPMGSIYPLRGLVPGHLARPPAGAPRALDRLPRCLSCTRTNPSTASSGIPASRRGDGVLNVEHIREGSQHLGPNVKVVEIQDGLHDLVLSRGRRARARL